MKLSIVIPAYNAQKTISRCIKSIINPLPIINYEILIIDDGSTDKTWRILKKYAHNNKIRLYQQANQGVSSARNTGIKKANGELLMFVDADDYLVKNWQHVIKKAIDQNTSADYIVFTSHTKKQLSKREIPTAICGYSPIINIGSPWSKIYNLGIIKNNNITFNPKVVNGEDQLFNLEYNLYSKNIMLINTGFYRYVYNNNSATHNFNPEFIRSDSIFRKQLHHLLNEYGSEYKFLSILSSINACLTLFKRYCYTEHYNRSKIDKLLTELDCNQSLNNYKTYSNYFSRSQLYLLKLIKERKYKTAYILTKIKTKLSYNKRKVIII